MSSFGGSIAALFVAGMVGGYGGLYLLGPTDETQTATLAAARVADPPALPCSMQAWPNADRKCLGWTAPRGDATAMTDVQKGGSVAPSSVTDFKPLNRPASSFMCHSSITFSCASFSSARPWCERLW